MTCWFCRSKNTVPRCKNVPCQACVDVANVDKEINHVMATLQRLLVKRCDLRSEQNRVHDSLVRLPVELKNNIFELLLPSRSEWGALEVRSRVMPLYLASICRAWRDIAWSNPFLWSTIQIEIGKKSSISDPQSRINFVHEWILRSRTVPLTLRIVVHKIKGFEKELKSVIGVISQCSNRWYSLFLDTPSGDDLSVFQHNNFQCHLLKRLKIISKEICRKEPVVPFLNLEVSPEKIEVCNISFKSLQISWNHLSCATVEHFTLEEISQLFQHALQMTCCRIWSPHRGLRDSSMPPITHRRLKSLGLYFKHHTSELGVILLRSLTLPRLQQFDTDEMSLLTPTSLPALVQGSSRITWKILGDLNSDNLQPLPGVTDLVLEFPVAQAKMKKLLLEEYLPELRNITINDTSFEYLWHGGIVQTLLDYKRPHPDVANKRRHLKIFVRKRTAFKWLGSMSMVLDELKKFKLDIRSRENGFELLIPW